jgi:hypothetical protein
VAPQQTISDAAQLGRSQPSAPVDDESRRRRDRKGPHPATILVEQQQAAVRDHTGDARPSGLVARRFDAVCELARLYAVQPRRGAVREDCTVPDGENRG